MLIVRAMSVCLDFPDSTAEMVKLDHED